MKTVELSARMQAVANMVSDKAVVCDVGCDHGFVSIYLIQQRIASKVYAMDVRKGPLERAKEHIKEYGLESYIETRLSDGLEAVDVGEATCMVCAGMGGPLMQKILVEGRDKAVAMSELILQPQSEIAQFRTFLRKEGYKIVQENMIYEDGKYYPMMKVVPVEDKQISVSGSKQEQVLFDMYGELLLKEKHNVLQRYLVQSLNYLTDLLQHLREQKSERALKRVSEIEKELLLIKEAQAYMGR